MNREKYFYELGIDNLISFFLSTMTDEQKKQNEHIFKGIKEILMRNYELIDISEKLSKKIE